MPGYYSNMPYSTPYGMMPSYSAPYGMQQGNMNNPSYMISVDGESAARAWQMPQNLPPNTIIPLWDVDGQHVYFKSVDAYGRLNPVRKGRIVFEEEVQQLPPAQNSMSGNTAVDMSQYVTKQDFDQLRSEIRFMISQQTSASASNAGNNQNGRNNRGESR